MQKPTARAEMIVRLPCDVKVWIERQAQKNCASQNSEVIRAVRTRMEAEGLAAELQKSRAS
jgi:Arc/MetJ-type ribon-helix-helix transcriptional regulator